MYKRIKRLLDLTCSLLLTAVVSPLLLLLMIVVRMDLGSPIFFRQKRTGLGKKTFDIIKFRTMTDKRDEDGNLLPDEMRSTKVGRFLRATSLDEFPELFNIIKGDMSVIGPRPLLPSYDAFYRKEEQCRFDVRGGLIPPEVIAEEPKISWDKQLEYEAWYAKNLSMKVDLRIFVCVFKLLFLRYKSDYGSYTRVPLNVERTNIALI